MAVRVMLSEMSFAGHAHLYKHTDSNDQPAATEGRQRAQTDKQIVCQQWRLWRFLKEFYSKYGDGDGDGDGDSDSDSY